MRKDWQWTLLAIFSVQCEFEEKRDCVSSHSNRNICLIQFKGEQFDECRSRVLRTYLIWFRPIPLKFSIHRPLYFVETLKSMWAHTENVRKQETKSTKNEEWMRDVVESWCHRFWDVEHVVCQFKLFMFDEIRFEKSQRTDSDRQAKHTRQSDAPSWT